MLPVKRLSKRILELKCCLWSGIFTTAVKRGVAPHTRKQRVQAAISKLRSTFFTGYKNKICTYCTYYIYIIGERAKRARHSPVCSIENRIYIYIYGTCKICSYNPQRRRSVILKLLPELFVYVWGATPRFTAAVKIPLPRQHFSSRILFDRKLSESYFFWLWIKQRVLNYGQFHVMSALV